MSVRQVVPYSPLDRIRRVFASTAAIAIALGMVARVSHGQTASFEGPAERLAAATVTVVQTPAASSTVKVADSTAGKMVDVSAATAVSLGEGCFVAAFRPAEKATFRIVLTGGEQASAAVSVVDENTSLVLLASGRKDLPSVKLAGAAPKIGAHVLAASAWGAEKPSVSQGILAARDRFLPQSMLPPLLQCDVRVNSASSGAGMVNSQGELVGLIVATGNGDRGGWTYALAAPHVQRLMDAHRKKPKADEIVVLPRQRAFAGLDLRQDERGGPLVVRSVVSGGPADLAGVRAGDEVRQIAGQPTQTAVEALAVLLSHQPQDTIDFNIRREGRDQSVRLTLGVAQTRPAVVTRKMSRQMDEARATDAQPPRASEPATDSPEASRVIDSIATGRGTGVHSAVIARLEQELKERDARIERLESEMRDLRRQIAPATANSAPGPAASVVPSAPAKK